MIRKYIFILLSVVCLSGCLEDETVDITVMPEITSTGADTFGYLFDGWLYVGGRYSSIYFEYDQQEETMQVKAWVKEEKTIRFTILSPREGEETTFVDARINDRELEDGTVKIIRFDKEEQIISGTFSGGRITHGRFDVHYIK